jgi:protoporphyrin/coproporphyrin ferrochelatase
MSRAVRRTAVLLLAHGSPESAEEIPEYLQRVTSGRTLPPQVVEEIAHRYKLVGFSPLTCWTMRQGDQLSAELRLPVYVGMRNWKPFIPDVLKRMVADGIEHAVVICLAPQNSRTSVGLYRRAVESDGKLPFTVDFVESWHDQPLLVKAFAEKLIAGWKAACREAGAEPPIIFTAHSVPQRTIVEGDPYQQQAHHTAELVAQAVGLKATGWTFAFQSQGMSGGPWIGPTVEETITNLKQRGATGIFLDPIGFLCDHVEVLYDIDIAFKQFAEKVGMRLWRAESLNDSLTLTAALADITRSRLRAALGSSA